MPAVFAAIDFAQRGSSLTDALALIAAGLLVTGAVVGGVHGLALVRLASRAQVRLS